MPVRSRTRTRLWRAAPGAAFLLTAVGMGIGIVSPSGSGVVWVEMRGMAPFDAPTVKSVASGSWMSSIELRAKDDAPSRELLVEAAAAIQNRILADPVSGDYFLRTPSSVLLNVAPLETDPEALDSAIAALSATVRDQGVPLLWIYVPSKEVAYADEVPAGLPRPMATIDPPLRASLKSTGDSVVDMSDLMNDPALRDQYYYRTDHHWTPVAASITVERTLKSLEALGLSVQSNAVPLKTYQSRFPFYGSSGRVATRGAGIAPDVFTWLAPAGGFRSRVCETTTCYLVPFDSWVLQGSNRYLNQYTAYQIGPADFGHLHNNDAGSPATVLVLHDSFGIPYGPLLAENVRDVYMVDEREYTAQTLPRLIAAVRPDAVIVIHSTQQYGELLATPLWTSVIAEDGSG